jgi:RND family efflux transporter MFP subunit
MIQIVDRKAVLLEQLRLDRSEGPRDPRPGTGRRWRLAVGVAVVVAILAGVWAYATAQRGIPVHTVMARPLSMSGGGGAAAGASLLDASGYVVAFRQATVAAKAILKVNDVLVQEGERVRQGQVIARLDDSNARAALDQSRAQVTQLEAALAAAKLAADDARPLYVRNKAQLDEGLISPEAYDNAKAAFDVAQTGVTVAAGNVAVARAAVQVNQRLVDDTVIRAPFDGVVTVRNAQPGEIVSPQFSGGGGIARIVDMDSLEVDVDVSENFINRVHPRQHATVVLNAYPDLRIPAQVIAVIPTADRSKATVKVRIGFTQKDARIVPEMGAHVSFLDDAAAPAATAAAGAGAAASAPGVIVAADAVQADGERGTVFVVDGDTVRRRTVRLGAATPDGQTVLSGLEPGSLVVTGDLSQLSEGSKVRVIP